MAHFVLIHGGLHGASCWEKLRPELEQHGHTSFAMDLPIDQPQTWMDDYADAVVESLAGQDTEGAYLVGHSMGGMVAPRVAAKLLGTRIIFLCAGFANVSEEERLESVAATHGDFFSWLTMDEQGRATMGREHAIQAFYGAAPPDLADWAIQRLRPQWHEAFAKVGPVQPYADRVAHVIYTLGDAIIDPERHRRMAEARFGITPIALPGDHSPFLSRPGELAQLLSEIVTADQAGRRYAPPA
jgi:pimeloyl-ACP methyl ester carboxylesterase